MNLLHTILCAVLVLGLDPLAHSAFTPRHLRELKHRTKQLFQHGWHSYMEYGFPADEVKPISCTRYGPQYTSPDDLHNDVLGNVSLTLLDNLDTLIMMREWDELEYALGYLERNQDTFFNQNYVVQVFEASIRWLGGLLLAHLALSELEWPADDDREISSIAARYDGFLLKMAYDLGLRLIPAYKTATHLPLPRINLAKGLDAVPHAKNREACTAGAATPYLELALLLRLTGDDRFEVLTRLTFDKLWDARLSLGLLPMSLDPIASRWLDLITGTGALIDSFYEYSLKGAILFDDNKLWDVFYKSYQSLVSHLAYKSGPNGYSYFANIHTTNGMRVTSWIDLLSAFLPGLQVLAGRLTDAVSSHLVYLKIWDHYDSIPERWDTMASGASSLSHLSRLTQVVPLEWYPLRPEFIESTYYLYRATKDPMYLEIGKRILDLFENRFKTKCGFAGFQDIRSGERQDRMETFVLGELLKYLFLLFDEDNVSYVHSSFMGQTNWIFSTEAHPLWLDKHIQQRSQERFSSLISSRKTPLREFKRMSLFGSMWRGLILPLNELELDLEDVGEHAYIPKTTPTVPHLQPAFNHLLVCEKDPSHWDRSRNFLGSGYYDSNKLFSSNEDMGDSLIRPEHFENLNQNGVIELLESFLGVYGLSPNKECAVAPTTSLTEFQIGSLKRPEQYEMYKVSLAIPGASFAVEDLVMPELSGRFRVEHLREGAIDSYNELITTDFLKDKFPADSTHFSSENEILRLSFINGLEVEPRITVWTQASYLNSNPDVFVTTKQGYVYLTGKFVQNLRVY